MTKGPEKHQQNKESTENFDFSGQCSLNSKYQIEKQEKTKFMSHYVNLENVLKMQTKDRINVE